MSIGDAATSSANTRANRSPPKRRPTKNASGICAKPKIRTATETDFAVKTDLPPDIEQREIQRTKAVFGIGNQLTAVAQQGEVLIT